ncbi:hypothetical protein [Bounagaea algeriensis]
MLVGPVLVVGGSLVGGGLGSVGCEVVGESLVGSGSPVLVGGGGALVPVPGGSGGGAGGRSGTSGSGRSCAEDAVVSPESDAAEVVPDRAAGEDVEEGASGGGCGGRDPGVVDSTAEVGCSVMSGPASSGRCDVATIAATAAKTVATPTPVATSSNRRFGRASGSCSSIAVLADSGGRSNTVATGRTAMIRRSAPVRPSAPRWCAAAAAGQA